MSVGIPRQSSSGWQIWVHALRLRTLPLSVAGIFLANVLAYLSEDFSWSIAILSLSTAMLLQIVANLANDYGDGVNQMDGVDRQGPLRATASGLVKPRVMLLVVGLACVLTILSGLLLLWSAWRINDPFNWGGWIGLGGLSVLAALAYTIGQRPYGYRGLGDLAVLFFFGYVAVMGTLMLHTNLWSQVWQLPVICAASAIGLWSVAVLNLNNMRDIESDSRHGKITVAVKLGLHKAQQYQRILLSFASLAWLGFLYTLWSLSHDDKLLIPMVLCGLLLIRHLRQNWLQATAAMFTQELQRLSRDVLVQVLVFAIIVLFF